LVEGLLLNAVTSILAWWHDLFCKVLQQSNFCPIVLIRLP